MDLAFIVTSSREAPDPAVIVAKAAEMDVELRALPSEAEPQVFELEDGVQLMVLFVDAPHPDAAKMPSGPISAPVEPLASAPCHLILTALGLEGPERQRDTTMAILCAAVLRATEAVGAMLGHGVLFQRAEVFGDLAALGAESGLLPIESAVDLTAVPEPNERMSFLSHGMVRYGREEFYLTCPTSGKGALGFMFSMIRWMLSDPDKQLPTGDTVGREEDEKILVQRVPNPTGAGPEVIRLDLP